MDTRDFKFIGKLPPGDWEFCLVVIKGQQDVVVVVDQTGCHAPRMIIGDELVAL